jgi:hypothetical protein
MWRQPGLPPAVGQPTGDDGRRCEAAVVECGGRAGLEGRAVEGDMQTRGGFESETEKMGPGPARRIVV